ncbi:unnamed protein product [Trichobilharzia regenti]|nr:unnamed protein product [Trichobilharzia regenti]
MQFFVDVETILGLLGLNEENVDTLPTECTKDGYVKSKPRVKSDICKEKTGGILKTNTSNSKDSIPPNYNNEVKAKCHTKEKLGSKLFPSQDPYVFIDDDDKENIDPNSRKQTTKKRVARAKLLSPTRPTGPVNQIMCQEVKQLYLPEPKKSSCVMNPQVALTRTELNQRNNLESSASSTPNVESKSLPSNITDKLVVVGGGVCSLPVISGVPDTPEHQNNVSVHTPNESIPVILKQAFVNLKPHISSTPAASNGTVISHPEFAATPINCPVNNKNIATTDNNNSNQMTDNQSQSKPISTSDAYTNTSEDNSSSKGKILSIIMILFAFGIVCACSGVVGF